MRVTIDLMKKSTQIIDLSNVINPRVGDDDLLLPLHICYGDNLYDMRENDVEFLTQDTNKNNIYIAGTCNTNTPGDNLYTGDLTFRFPAGTFKVDGTYDPDQTMFRIVDKATQKVISSVNVKITVMKNAIEFNFDPDKSSYDSRAETMLQDFHDKGQAMLDEIKDLNNQAKSNVSGDTATTAEQAKEQASKNASDITGLQGEVVGARGRYADLPGREDAQDTAISQKETIVNANANYAALQQKDAQQDAAIAQKAGKFELEDKLSQMDLQPEGFENEAALKAKYPNGKSGIMVTVDTGHKYIWANGTWTDAGIYQAVGLPNGSVTIRKLGDDVNNQLYSYADSIKKLNRVVDPAFELGIIDPSTHIPNISEHSIAIHSRMIPISNDVLHVQFPSTAISTVFYYKSGQYVISNPSIPGPSYYTAPDNDADGVILLFSYNDNTDMKNASDLGDQITITSLASADITARVDKAYQLDGFYELPFLYHKNINTGFGIGQTVPLIINKISPYKLAQIDCNGGDFYLINGSGGNYPRLWTFLDENQTILSTAGIFASASDLLIIAPKKAKSLIINQTTDLPCFKVDREATRNFKIDRNSFIPDNSIQLGKYALGDVVDLTPTPTTNYRYLITDCQAGDQIYVVGQGGNNPRLYGFLDANNKLLEIADANTQGNINHMVITAPANTTTVVFNFNFSAPGSLYSSSLRFDRESISAGLLSQQDKEITNFVSKLPITQVPQLSKDYMASFIGGQTVSSMFAKPLGDLAISTDLMAHCSSFRIINENIYAAFYVNKKSAAENPKQHTAIFRRASLSNLSSITNVELCNIGDSVLGQTVNAIYDTVILKKDDDNDNLYLLFTAMLGTDYYLLYRKYTISNDTLSDISKCQFTVNTTTNDFSITGMKQALDANNITYPNFSTDVSFMQQLSTRVENGVTYYYTGIGVLDFCFIAKSSDLINWVFVSQPDFPTTSKFEPAVYVIGDVAYYLCRQDYSSSYAFLTTYNLVTHVWATPVNIPDCQSRSVFFTNSGALYALHAPKDRNHIAILHIDTNNLDQSEDIAVGDVDDMFYPFIQDDNGHLYVTITQTRKHIWLCNFEVPDTNTSIAKLNQVFGG